MRQRLVKALRPLDARSVENSVGPGTPDINYSLGWIECKWIRKWPDRETTPVRLPHDLEKQQRVWIRRRIRIGGIVYVAIQCRSEWLFIPGEVASDIIGQANRRELIAASAFYFGDGINPQSLIGYLRNDPRLRSLC